MPLTRPFPASLTSWKKSEEVINMKKYFEIPRVCTEALNPVGSVMDEPLASMNLARSNTVDYGKILTDTTTGEYNIWKGFKNN